MQPTTISLVAAIVTLLYWMITCAMARATDQERRAMLLSALRGTDDEQRASLDY